MNRNIVLLATLAMAACASAATDNKQSVTIASDPSGADCEVSYIARPYDKPSYLEFIANVKTPETIVIERSYSALNVACVAGNLMGELEQKSKVTNAGMASGMAAAIVPVYGIVHAFDAMNAADREYPATIHVKLQ